MRNTQVELNENLYARENDSKSNRGLAWLRICLYVFPMWVPKGCCIVKKNAIKVMIFFAVTKALSYSIYNI